MARFRIDKKILVREACNFLESARANEAGHFDDEMIAIQTRNAREDFTPDSREGATSA